MGAYINAAKNEQLSMRCIKVMYRKVNDGLTDLLLLLLCVATG